MVFSPTPPIYLSAVETQNIRLQLVVHYDGSGFHGWQLQPDLRTVQGELQACLSRLANSPRTIVGSGRTDTGVHAKGQVASVDMPAKWDAATLHRSLNAVLPGDVWVESVRAVRGDFHPRYDAVARSYEYHLGLSAAAASPFHRRWCWALCAPILLKALQEGAAQLVGERSFEAFAKSGQPERGYRCTVTKAAWTEWEFGARFRITADRYLHHMVRYLVGTTVDIARGRRPADDMARLLANDPALETSPPAPPEGLFLAQVEYPVDVLTPLASDASDSRRTTPE
jgi:tRNA pseudouridine38-40 synthase